VRLNKSGSIPCTLAFAKSSALNPRQPAGWPKLHPASPPCGLRNSLGLKDLRSRFWFLPSELCVLHFPLGRLQQHPQARLLQAKLLFGAIPPNEILLCSQRTRLGQAGTAPDFRPLRVPGVPLLLRQWLALVPRLGGGPESCPRALLLRRARIFGNNIPMPALFPLAHVIDIPAAPATLGSAIHFQHGM
jgi:hypothetical protein